MRKFKSRRSPRQPITLTAKQKKQLIGIAVIVVVIIISIAVISNARSKQAFEASSISEKDIIRIGLRTDIGSFSSTDEQGEITGYDRDYIDALLAQLFPGQDKLYEYVPITSQDAGASLKYNEADICLGLLAEGINKTNGFVLTTPYYTDQVVAVLRADSRVDSIGNIADGKLGILTSSLPDEKLADYLETNNFEHENILKYTDYESIMTDLQQGHVDAVVVPGAIARKFENAGFRILAQPLFEVGYCMMLPTTQSGAAQELNRVIEEFEQNGTAQGLRDKWGL